MSMMLVIKRRRSFVVRGEKKRELWAKKGIPSKSRN